MATVESDLCSEIRGDVGDKTYRTTKAGKISVNNKEAMPTFRDEKVKDERDKRISGFGGSGHMAYVVGEAIMLGFPLRRRGEKPMGQFMKYNAVTLCKAEPNEEGKLVWTYDFPAMVLSKGNLDEIEATATFDKESGMFMFTQKEDRAGSRAKLDDMAYAFVLGIFSPTSSPSRKIDVVSRTRNVSTRRARKRMCLTSSFPAKQLPPPAPPCTGRRVDYPTVSPPV